MNLIMSGVDYKTADLATREQFSQTALAVQNTLERIKENPCVEGCVLLSTCNRTELYLSCTPDSEAVPLNLLCEALELNPEEYRNHFITRKNRQALDHLMMVAAGLHSQIRGEDQILAQVKTAAQLAREAHTSDGVLETLFRCAVSAAKKAKTEAPLSPMETSVATRALEVLREQAGNLDGKHALVIGNGKMGRLAASLLVREKCRVTVTLRSYKHGEIAVPQGCETVAYDDRYSAMMGCDILVSATASPHHTITADRLQACRDLPRWMMDLAVPRDIDPAVAELPDVQLWNVDALGGKTGSTQISPQMQRVNEILQEYTQRFYKWLHYREDLRPAVCKRTVELC